MRESPPRARERLQSAVRDASDPAAFSRDARITAIQQAGRHAALKSSARYRFEAFLQAAAGRQQKLSRQSLCCPAPMPSRRHKSKKCQHSAIISGATPSLSQASARWRQRKAGRRRWAMASPAGGIRRRRSHRRHRRAEVPRRRIRRSGKSSASDAAAKCRIIKSAHRMASRCIDAMRTRGFRRQAAEMSMRHAILLPAYQPKCRRGSRKNLRQPPASLSPAPALKSASGDVAPRHGTPGKQSQVVDKASRRAMSG